MAFDPYGDPVFGVADGMVAPRTGVGAWGAGVDVMAIQMFTTNLEPVTANLPGDDQIVAVHSILSTGQVVMRFAGALITVFEVVFGLASVTSQPVSGDVRVLRFPPAHRFPYFGAAAKSQAAEGTGQQEVFCPMAKVASQVRVTMNEYGAFQTMEFTAQLIGDAEWGLINVIQVENERALTIPPADVAPEA